MVRRQVYRAVDSESMRLEIIDIECRLPYERRVIAYHALIEELHDKFRARYENVSVLEISSRSPHYLGSAVQTKNLMLTCHGFESCVEVVYLSSLKFSYGGPYFDLLTQTASEAKKDVRLRATGRVVRAVHEGIVCSPKFLPLYYAYLFCKALLQQPKLAASVAKHRAFSDVSFDPLQSPHCVAHAAAIYSLLHHHGVLENAMQNLNQFIYIARRIKCVRVQKTRLWY